MSVFHRRYHRNPVLDWVIAREDMARISDALTDVQWEMAYLRAEGLSDDEIAAVLETTRNCVSGNIVQAKRRIVRLCPDLADAVADRYRWGYRRGLHMGEEHGRDE